MNVMHRKPIQLSCVDCGHCGVCKILPNVESLIGSLYPKESKQRPVCQPEDFANICGAFIPKSQLEEFHAATEIAAAAPTSGA